MAVTIILVGALVILGFAIFLINPPQNSSVTVPQAAVITNTALAKTVATVTTITATPITRPVIIPSPTIPAIILSPVIQPTPPISEPGLTVISPTVAIGVQIPTPLKRQMAIYVFRTADRPLITLQQARTAVYNNGMDWALGGTHEGKTVTLTAVYGLVTLGGPNTGGNKQGWLGPQNFDLPTCSSDGKCSSTGVILSHIEKRPMWVLDYGNTDFPAAGQACLTTPCPTPQIFNHSVYTVDGQTGAIFTGDFYTLSLVGKRAIL